ncbi:hypothetical protein AKO1_006160 [Acrasis kona]|uniref:sphingomyelin phosphodiesterase n=1 Tax=Acrasis kona TaxID=1008807 RepID=A0AAW2YIC3_9EUKA
MSDTLKDVPRIRILSYNMFMRPFVNTNGNDYKPERLKLFMENETHKFDVLCLQELFSMGGHNRKYELIEGSKKHGLLYSTSLNGSWLSLKPIDSGLLILTKYPILDKDAIVFQEGADIDGWSTKGAISALVSVPTEDEHDEIKMLIVNTHTQAEYSTEDPKYYDIQRKQIEEVRQFIIKKHKQFPKAPIILCGDFNINARTSALSTGEDSTEAYKTLVSRLNFEEGEEWKDLIYEKMGHHPVTFGDGDLTEGSQEIIPKETVLTGKEELGTRTRLDYMFYHKHCPRHHEHAINQAKPDTREDIKKKAVLVIDASVQPFFVEDQEFTQLSDHYGISAELGIIERNHHLFDNTKTFILENQFHHGEEVDVADVITERHTIHFHEKN